MLEAVFRTTAGRRVGRSHRVRIRNVPRAFVDLRALPYRSATTRRSSCDDVSRHGGRQQHECRDTGSSHHEGQLRVSQRDCGEQAAQAERRRFGGCLHPCEHVRHSKPPYGSEYPECGTNEEQPAGQPQNHDPSRSMYCAYATVPTKLINATTIATSRNACCVVNPAVTTRRHTSKTPIRSTAMTLSGSVGPFPSLMNVKPAATASMLSATT